jgi:hypothetical protein
MRYEDLLDIPPLERDRILALVDEVQVWADEQLGSARG